MTQRRLRHRIAATIGLLAVSIVTPGCGAKEPVGGGVLDKTTPVIEPAGTSGAVVTADTVTSTSDAVPIMTSTTLDPGAAGSVPPGPSVPPCSAAEPDLLLIPTGHVSAAHLALEIVDPGANGRTTGGEPVFNAALVVGDRCQTASGTVEPVETPWRPPRWRVLSVDGTLPDPAAGLDVAHLTGRSTTTLEFYNCAGADPRVNLADALASIVAASSLTCLSSESIYAG